MRPDDAFERCLASLYGAALDDARWPAATSLLEETVGTGGSTLAVAEGFDDDARLHFVRVFQRGRGREDLAREFFDVYLPHDEGIPRLRLRRHGELVRVPDLYTEAELKTSPVYNEGLRRMGSRDGLVARFDGPEGLRIVWGMGDPVGGGWRAGGLGLLRRLLPHVHRSVLIRQALAAAEALGVGLAGLLDNDRIGVVQLDRGGRVLVANAPALEILRRGDGLVDRDGALEAWLPADRSRLRRLVGGALPGWLGEAPGGGSMTVQRASGRARLGVHVSPVGDAAADFGGRRVAALVLVVDPARRPRIDAARVEKMLGLTPSEARLAALLAEGLKVREIAATTGWRENYVRWLVRQVYRKLGASGQVDVVRQVLAVDILPRR
ncbi:MAG: helix-turn-helix transcriptional regulator [Gammaproteobacteria bacterium]|nr:helix-turn-helix transcriptional regulator [Gammaproteobacteria bacterium]